MNPLQCHGLIVQSLVPIEEAERAEAIVGRDKNNVVLSRNKALAVVERQLRTAVTIRTAIEEQHHREQRRRIG